MNAPENISILKDGELVEQFYKTANGTYVRYYPVVSGDTPQPEHVMLSRCQYAKSEGFTILKG